MVEQRITDLFFKLHPNAEGALGEKEVLKLNRVLARLYDEHAGGVDDAQGAPPPEPLPAGTVRFPGFRTSVHRALATLCGNADEKEKVLAYLIAEAQVPDEPKVPVLSDVVAIAVPAEEQGVDIVDDAPVAVSCWSPPVLTPEQRQSLQRYIDVVNEASNHEATQKTLEVAKTLSSLAVQSSKQVLETARVYGMHALVGAQSFGKQLRAVDEERCTMHPGRRPVPQACQTGENQDCRGQLQQENEGSCLQPHVEQEPVLDRILEDALPLTAPVAHEEQHGYRLPLPPSTTRPPSLRQLQERAAAAHQKQPSADDQLLAESVLPETQSRGREVGSTTVWRYDAGDGLHMDVRSQPDLGAARTGKYLLPGEAFRVSQESKGQDGVLYLRLADGRGWVFESKPGVGAMCFRSSPKA